MSFFVFSAVTLMLIGGFFVVLTSHFLRDRIAEEILCTGEVMATVIDVQAVTSSSSGDGIPTTSWYPVYEYTVGDVTVQKRSLVGLAKDKYHTGQQVRLRYDPSNINMFYNPEDGSKNLFKILLIIGIALIIAGIAVFVVGMAVYSKLPEI